VPVRRLSPEAFKAHVHESKNGKYQPSDEAALRDQAVLESFR